MVKKAEKIVDRTLLWKQVGPSEKEYTEKGEEIIKRR